jgi:COP9 signalosome complex subunit 3
MDQIASVLLSFPSGQELKGNDEYHAAAKAHVKHLNQLKQTEPALLASHAPQLLQVTDANPCMRLTTTC